MDNGEGNGSSPCQGRPSLARKRVRFSRKRVKFARKEG